MTKAKAQRALSRILAGAVKQQTGRNVEPLLRIPKKGADFESPVAFFLQEEGRRKRDLADFATQLARAVDAEVNNHGYSVRTCGPLIQFVSHEREPEHEESQNNSDSEHFSVRPIGKVHSIWREKFGCPRQGSLCSGPARVTLSPDLDPTALRSLEQYSHCWLLFLFDRNANFDATNKTSSLRSLVWSVFIRAALTRVEETMCTKGLSLVKIKSIEGNTLHLENVDLVDGTPVIDVKPVHPSDVPQQVKYPTWLPSNDALLGIDTALVKWHPLALQQLHQVTDFDLLTSAQEAHNVINDTLKMDCRTAHSKANHGDGAYYGLSIDSLLVDFQVNTNPLTFTVVRVRHERATQTPQRSKQWLHELQEYVAQHSMECEPECE